MQDSKEPISESCDNLYEDHLQENLTLTGLQGKQAVGELSQRGF